jgi:hypothetical protein
VFIFGKTVDGLQDELVVILKSRRVYNAEQKMLDSGLLVEESKACHDPTSVVDPIWRLT